MRQLFILGWIAALLPSCATTPGERQQETAVSTGGDHPLGSGSVEFVGFDRDSLQAIRVIPEEGLAMFAPPGDTRIENVDGFWWKGSRQWFKIPDHCHASVKKIPAGLQFSHDCSRIGTRVQKLRGGVTEPRWQIDAGATSHPTDYPF